MKKRALISVSDKTGLEGMARCFFDKDIEIISTGGTADFIRKLGIPVIGISEITKFPECLDGRVKTLHPAVHAGLLAKRDNFEHIGQIQELNILPIDFLIVNLYPFKKTIDNENTTLSEAIEQIDIGGPSMLRSAAKNNKDVVVVCDPLDYGKLIAQLDKSERIDDDFKLDLAIKVFEQTAYYDSIIVDYLRSKKNRIEFPELLSLKYEKVADLRYGENPHQFAALYKEPTTKDSDLIRFQQLHGKEMSFNNFNDSNAALELLQEFEDPTIVVVKHTNPCGIASADTISNAFLKAYEADKVSIFGGIIASNREIDESTAKQINEIFIEVVLAPSYSEEALVILEKKKNIRLLQVKLDTVKENRGYDIKKISGGVLVQTKDCIDRIEEFKVVTQNSPSETEYEDLLFALKIVKHVKSNAIVIAKNKQTLGLGTGQTNRIWAMEHALASAGDNAIGSVVASDAFFPFDDCVELAASKGVKAIIQPGGSLRDTDSIAASDRNAIAMVFTGKRHFKH